MIRANRFARIALRIARATKIGKNLHAHKNKIGTSTPPLVRNPNTPLPLKGGTLWAWGLSSRKNQKMPGAHKIGAAVSGPRIAGGNFMDITLFPNQVEKNLELKLISIVF